MIWGRDSMSQYRISQPSEDAEVRLPRGSEAVQTLRKQLESVERESVTLQRIASGLDDFVNQQEGRLAELEQELNDTALLYVAGEQFHTALDPQQVLRHIRELLEQLLGAEVFAVYLRSGPGNSSVAVIASRGLSESQLADRSAVSGPLDAVLSSGKPIIVQQPLPSGSMSAPVATIPLLLEERTIGAVVIAKLFAHKERWAQVDAQLLSLLSTRTGPALLAAHLIRTQSDLLGTLAGLGESLK
jgi:hypothetical protein